MSDGWATYQAEYRPYVPPPKEDRSCRCSETDEYGRRCIGWCGPDCEGRP